MVRVTDYRMAYVLQVSAQLVPASGNWAQQYQAIARRGVSVHGYGQIRCRQALEQGDRVLRARLQRAAEPRRRVAAFGQGMLDGPLFWTPSAHDGDIGFACAAMGKLAGECSRCLWCLSKQQNAGCGFVEAMDRVDPVSQLVSQQLQGEAGFAGINGAAVNQ